MTLLLVYNSTYSSVIAFSYITLIASLILVMYLCLKEGLKIDRLFINFTFFFGTVSLFLLFSLPEFDFFLTGYNYLKILYAYLSIKAIGSDFFKHIVNIAYYGAIISFPLYVLQLLNYDLAFRIIGFVQHNIDFLSWRNSQMANNVFFTINGDGAFRNSGFMWEPKGFASFIVVAIIFRLLVNGLKVNDRKILVFFIAILTTLSTTGILSLFLISSFYILNKNRQLLLLILPAFLVVSVYVFMTSEILYKKILYEISLKDEHEMLLNKDDYESDVYSLGRTGSLLVDFKDFTKRPIFGYGFTRENRTQSAYVKLVRVNGFSDLLAIYGTGIILYFHRHYVFLKLMNRRKYRYIMILILTFIFLYFASTFTGHPFWTSLLFASVIVPKSNSERKMI